MRKNARLWGTLALVAFASLAFIAMAPQKAPTEAAAFWTYITKTHPYTKWTLWPGHEAMHPGMSPHGAYLKVFVNKAALDAINKKAAVMPDGAIIVKENYGDDKKTLAALTVMSKVKNYDPAAGDWYWTEFAPDGKEMASGKAQVCIDCHAKKKDADFIYTWAK